jgi:hypothetical protein
MLECIAVRDSRAGELIGFAPMYRRTLLGRRSPGTSLQPLGTGRRQGLTEVVQLLSLPARTPEVSRAVGRHLEGSEEWNWLQLSLSPDQGWFVPQWLEHHGQ